MINARDYRGHLSFKAPVVMTNKKVLTRCRCHGLELPSLPDEELNKLPLSRQHFIDYSNVFKRKRFIL